MLGSLCHDQVIVGSLCQKLAYFRWTNLRFDRRRLFPETLFGICERAWQMVRKCGSWTSGANNCIVFGEPPHLYTMGARVPAPGEGTKTSAKHFAANRKGLFTGGMWQIGRLLIEKLSLLTNEWILWFNKADPLAYKIFMFVRKFADQFRGPLFKFNLGRITIPLITGPGLASDLFVRQKWGGFGGGSVAHSVHKET